MQISADVSARFEGANRDSFVRLSHRPSPSRFEALIIEDIGLASLELLELRFELEERWKTRITDEEAIRLKTIHDVVDLIAEHSREK